MKLFALFLGIFSANSSAYACNALPNLSDTLPALDGAMNVQDSLNQAWALKLSVRTLMKSDYENNALTRECSNHYKKFFIDLRAYEDRVAILGVKKKIKTTDMAYTTNNKQLFVAPGQVMGNLRKDLQSGDIILSRGNAFTSAAISHMGDSEQQFSHMSLVYKDPKTGLLYTTEAHIEIGVVAKPLQANIDEMNSRDVVYRFQDQTTAHKAAEYMYKLASTITDKTGSNINYDFDMNMKDSRSLFCSEVVSRGFEVASKKQIQIPMFQSDLTRRHLAFQKAIEVNQTQSFLPADIEVDPRFTLLAEWKDWTKTRDLIEKDAIIRSIFSWMDNKGYEFDQSYNTEVWFKKNIGYGLRRTPLFSSLVDDKMPLNMSRNLIGLFTVLDQVGETLQEFLTKANDKAMKKSNGILPTEEAMMAYLEKIRVLDSKLDTPFFHDQLHPAE